MLENEVELPAELKARKLIGQYKGCMECHIEGDFLLIWFDEDSQFIVGIPFDLFYGSSPLFRCRS